MANPFGRMRLFVNPMAGRGRVGQLLPRLEAALAGQGLTFDTVHTTRRGEAAHAARTALEQGVRYLVAVGGDGTVHDVVNGMFKPDADANPVPLAPAAVLGVVSAGSGADFARTFGLSLSVETIAAHMAGTALMPIDVGRVDCTGSDGRPQTRLFANIAQAGWGAEVVRRADRLPRLLGRVRYLLAAYGAILAVRRQETSVTLAHTTVTVPLVDLIVANGQFFGGAMKVAPRALPDDGLFNVQLFTGARSQVFVMTSQIYRGEHLPHPEIAEYQSPVVSLAPDAPVPVEADGELLGTTPATFSLLPRALRLKI